MQKIVPCLWFNHNAEEAAVFYQSVFKNTKKGDVTHYSDAVAKDAGMRPGETLTIDLTIEDLQITLLNAGPEFKFTPAVSLYVLGDDEAEIKGLWEKLSKGGEPRMELGSYPWSKYYGWTTDKYGVDWQLNLRGSGEGFAKIVPSLLYVNERYGRAAEAVKFYTGLFPGSEVLMEAKTPDGKAIAHARFKIDGQEITIMEGEGKHNWDFTMAFSLAALCKDQKTIDAYWDALSSGGQAGPCGWVTDKFGLSWQVIPENFTSYRHHPQTFDKVMAEVMKMKKLDIATIDKAAKA